MFTQWKCGLSCCGIEGVVPQVRARVSGRAGWRSLDCSCLHKIWPRINQTASVSIAAVPKPPWAKITKVEWKKIDFLEFVQNREEKLKVKSYLLLLTSTCWQLKANVGYSESSTTRVYMYVSAKQVRQDHVPMLINTSLLKLCQFIPVKDIIPECNNLLCSSL